MSIGRRVANGALWMLALKAAMKIIGLVSTVLLARLLTPEDFGLIAIIMAIFAFVEVFGNFSFDTVLIQKHDADRAHYDTAWTFNFIFGLVACLLIFLSSGWIAEFYGDSRLRAIAIALGFLFLISGAQNIGVVQFRKELTFNLEFKFQLIPKILSFFVTLTLAFWLRNYWALIWGALVWRFLIVAFSYKIHPYRPRLTFSEWKSLFWFSKWLMVNNVFYFINNRSPELIVGKILSPQSAGLFSIAQEFATMPTSELVGNINAATYPGYCKVSHDRERLNAMYLSVISMIAVLVFPAGLGLSAISDVLVPVVLGPKWLEVTPLLSLLAVSGLLIALNTNTGFLFLARAQPRVTTLMSCFRALVLFPSAIFFGLMYGLIGVAWSIFLTAFLAFFVFLILIKFNLNIGFKCIFKVFCRPVLASAGMYVAVNFFALYFVNLFGGVLALASLFLLGFIVYCFCLYCLWFSFGKPDGPETRILDFLQLKFPRRA